MAHDESIATLKLTTVGLRLVVLTLIEVKYEPFLHLFLRPGSGAEYCDQPICLCVCLSASISLESMDRSVRNFVCRSTVTRSSSGGVALRHVLPVSWMTSHLAVVGGMSVHGLSVAKYSAPRGVARPGRSLISMNALLHI